MKSTKPQDPSQEQYESPHITPELAIEIFGETAREPVTHNLQLYCDQWLHKKQWLQEAKNVVSSLGNDQGSEFLRGVYDVYIRGEEKAVWQCERHIRRLQSCLELLEQKRLFSRPIKTSPGMVDVSALKERIDIADVIGQFVELRQAGATCKGRCPFHNDRTPSFVVYPNNGRWWCFACNEGGDVISFVQKIRNCGFREAVAELQRI
ncbi:MAG: CHC2 zinc finger domain-containing protein [Parcubacteria group bacterium]